MQEYSALEHLAKALFVEKWRATSWGFMKVIEPMTAYFDESRVDDANPFPVVAGFCNSYDVWEMFGKKWKEATKHIPDVKQKKYFRCRSTEDEQRYRDSTILAHVMRDFTLWPIHVTIERAFFQFDIVDKKNHPLMSSAYSVCSFGCCELLDHLAQEQKFTVGSTPIKVVFDKGNADERWLDKGYRTYYSQKPETSLKKTPIFEDDDDLIPLRAADAYAWLLSRKYNENEELEQLKIIQNPKFFLGREMVITKEKAQTILGLIPPAL